MSTMTVDALRRDECQPMTTAQMESAKAQIRPRNRANVNIVPYEIYDEDGVEQVVGEVRKTIDGVRKKKPVYKRVIIKNSPSSVTSDWASFQLVDSNMESCIQLYAHTDVVAGTYMANYTSDFLIKQNGGTIYIQLKNSSMCNKPVIMIIRYTKTTDEWEEADE